DSTAIVEDFVSLTLARDISSRGIKVRRVTGSMTQYTDFTHHDVLLQGRHECDYLKTSYCTGRSIAWLPYMGVDFDSYHGIELAIGWTGTWAVETRYADRFYMNVGIGEKTYFRMAPGERFMMPYTVIYDRKDKTVEEGLVEFHRFIMAHKSPRDSKGRLVEPFLPLTGSGGNKTDENLLTIIKKGTSLFKDIPFNVLWVDAGWYGAPHEVEQQSNCGPYWYKWAGYWTPNTWAHPDGNMKKVAKAARKKGMKFLLWFEPERATKHAPVTSAHPEWFHRTKENPHDEIFLLDLGNDEAREWVTDEVSRNIRESGVDIYRQDFNLDPLPIWRDADSPDRMGISEIRHINGLYAYWDELHRRFPDMMFENCAGGGTRMDIEMMSRSHSYCRDDAHMFPQPEELTQNITLNSTCYIPFTGGETFRVEVFDTYAWLSCMGAGTVFTPSDFDGMLLGRDPSDEEVEWFTRMLKVSDRVRHLFQGDFYALTDTSYDGSDIFCGYQLDNPETGEGFYIVFRRAECPASGFDLRLRGIDASADYTVERFEGGTSIVKGGEFSRTTLTFDEPRSYQLVFYKKK
ncbi:MAG: alpha-galactosidase, partial [Bacteroidales bacterium]|nr:alpha-galactosidase [Bacteroidales bacterium]